MSDYAITVFFDEHARRTPWVCRDYTLAVALGVDTAYQAEGIVRDALAATDPALGDRLVFDSEWGCFFAYASTRGDAERVARLVADLVAAGPHPSAVAGDWRCSPAAVHRWDPDDPALTTSDG